MNKFQNHIIAFLLAGLLLSCEKEPSYDYGPFRLDIVTYQANNIPAYFILEKDKEESQSLIPTERPSLNNIKDGTRVMLQYIKDEAINDKEYYITIKGLSRILSDSLRGATPELMKLLQNDTIRLNSIWKSGDYLNIKYQSEFHNIPHSQILVTEKDKLMNDTIVAEIRHNRRNDPPGYWSNSVSSYYIGALKNRPCKILKVYVNNINYPEKYYYFRLKKE